MKNNILKKIVMRVLSIYILVLYILEIGFLVKMFFDNEIGLILYFENMLLMQIEIFTLSIKFFFICVIVDFLSKRECYT